MDDLWTFAINCTVVKKNETPLFIETPPKLSQRNETGTNHHRVLSTLI